MAEQDNDQPTVLTFISGWLGRIEGKLDDIFKKLDDKADRTELTELRRRMEHGHAELGRRIDAESARTDAVESDMEHRTRSRTERVQWRQYAVPALLSLGLLVVGVIQLVK